MSHGLDAVFAEIFSEREPRPYTTDDIVWVRASPMTGEYEVATWGAIVNVSLGAVLSHLLKTP